MSQLGWTRWRQSSGGLVPFSIIMMDPSRDTDIHSEFEAEMQFLAKFHGHLFSSGLCHIYWLYYILLNGVNIKHIWHISWRNITCPCNGFVWLVQAGRICSKIDKIWQREFHHVTVTPRNDWYARHKAWWYLRWLTLGGAGTEYLLNKLSEKRPSLHAYWNQE